MKINNNLFGNIKLQNRIVFFILLHSIAYADNLRTTGRMTFNVDSTKIALGSQYQSTQAIPTLLNSNEINFGVIKLNGNYSEHTLQFRNDGVNNMSLESKFDNLPFNIIVHQNTCLNIQTNSLCQIVLRLHPNNLTSFNQLVSTTNKNGDLNSAFKVKGTVVM